MIQQGVLVMVAWEESSLVVQDREEPGFRSRHDARVSGDTPTWEFLKSLSQLTASAAFSAQVNRMTEE